MDNSVNSTFHEKESINDNLKKKLEKMTDIITSKEITHKSDVKNTEQNIDETKNETNFPKEMKLKITETERIKNRNNDDLENSQIQKSQFSEPITENCVREQNVEKNLQNNLNGNKSQLERKLKNQENVNMQLTKKNAEEINLSNEQIITEQNENLKMKENSLKVQNELQIENENEDLNKSKNELLENQELEIKISSNRVGNMQLETEIMSLENDKLNLSNFQSETNINYKVLENLNETKSCLELSEEVKSSEIQEIKNLAGNETETVSILINSDSNKQSRNDESESRIDLTKSINDENVENSQKNKSQIEVKLTNLTIDENVENLDNKKIKTKSDIEFIENGIHSKDESVFDSSMKELDDEEIQDNLKLQIISDDSDENCKEKKVEHEIEDKSESGIELDRYLTEDEISFEEIKSSAEKSENSKEKEKDKTENERVMNTMEDDNNDDSLKESIVNEIPELDNGESLQTNENTNLNKKEKITTADIEDPLSLDDDLKEKLIKIKSIQQTEENPSSTLIASKSDANLFKNPVSLANESICDKENQQLQKSEKSIVNYIVKTNASKSMETIELLDSDDDDKDNNDNEKITNDNNIKYDDENDDDIILVSEKGLKKNSKSKKDKSSVPSSKPMFAISSVHSIGLSKTNTNYAIKSTTKHQLNKNELNEDEIDIYTAIRNLPDLTINRTSNENVLNRTKKNSINTVTSSSDHTVTIKKNGSSSSSSSSLTMANDGYQATLRVRTPIKEPETLSTKDFLSAFQHFSANNNSNNQQKSINSKFSRSNKSMKRHLLSSSSLLTTSRKLNIDETNVQAAKMNNNSIEDEICKEWLENFIKNLLNPMQIKSKLVLDILQKCLSPERYFQIKILIDNHNNLDKAFIYIVTEKVIKLLNDGRTIEKFVLVVKSVNDINFDEMNREIHDLFIKNNVITDIGYKFYEISLNKNNCNKVLTTNSRNGQVTCRSLMKYSRKCDVTICSDNNGKGNDNGGKNDDDDDDEEYSPNVTIDVDENKKQERRRSLRRDSKAIDWKQYFAYDDEDDDVVIEQQMNKKAKNDKKTTKRLSPSKYYEDDSINETIPERKKFKIEDNISIQTPFDTDLLTPMWFETDDPVEESFTKPQTAKNVDSTSSSLSSKNVSKSRRKSNHHASTLTNRRDETIQFENVEKDDTNSVTSLEEKILIKKNTNPIYHCSSKFIDMCLLCGEKVQHTVSHYVNEHTDREVIISRLPQCDIDNILQNINYAFISNQKDSLYGRTYQYASKCIFCKRDMNVALRYWWEHFTMHTGEYSYECTGCKAKRPRKQALQTHIQGQCKKSRKAKVKEIYEFDKSITEIQCYICVLCNYVQLHRINVEKHLRTEHDMNVYEIELNIIKGVLIQFSKPYIEQDELQQQRQQQQQLMMSSLSSATDSATTTVTTANYMDYTNFLQSSDDLSFMICNMLASDDNFESSLNSSNSNVPQSSHNNAHNLAKNEGK